MLDLNTLILLLLLSRRRHGAPEDREDWLMRLLPVLLFIGGQTPQPQYTVPATGAAPAPPPSPLSNLLPLLLLLGDFGGRDER